MTGPSFERLEALLAEALELPASDVPGFVERECGGDAPLKEELLALIEAHQAADGYFEGLASEIAGDALLELETAARPKVAIGPYRASAVVGRGGMGVVYRAERVDGQFTQEVAIKLLHLDLQSPAIEARFLAERQLLAGLSHPNIARLLDGGVTSEGRAYFVMEYVDGLPITAWCRRRKLGVRAILELFQEVIAAVSYLHRNLVVHRDLKPGNILIDAQGRVKLLDFGIAKLLAEGEVGGQTLTGDRLLTPAYAAPEQLLGGSITTATDVYALGAVLYELLAGCKPHPLELGSAAVSRGVPTAPSAALRGADDGGEGSSVGHSWRRLRGDPDAICLMALRPEADRRYASAEQLGEDIERHLTERPTRAGKGTMAYRLSRFMRRHRAALVVIGLVLAALTLGLARERGLRAEAQRARDMTASESAKTEAVSTFLAGLLASADPSRAQGEDLTVSELLAEAATRIDDDDALADQPDVEAVLRLTLGRTLTSLGKYEQAAPHLEEALALRRSSGRPELDAVEAIEALGVLRQRAGEYGEAERLLLEVVNARRRLLGDEHPDTLTATSNLANLYWYQRRYDEVEVLDRRTLDVRLRVLGADHPDTLKSLNGLGTTLFSRAHFEEAAEIFRRGLETAGPLLGDYHPDTLRFRNNLSASLSSMGRVREAEPVSRAVLEGRRKVLGPEHQDTATAVHNLGVLLMRQGRYEEAEPLIREAIRVRSSLTSEASARLFSQSFLADIYRNTGRIAEARELYEGVLAEQRETLGAEHADALRTASSLAMAHLEVGELPAARALGESTLVAQRSTLGSAHPDHLTTLSILARIALAEGLGARAETLCSEAIEEAAATLGETHPAVLEAVEVKVLALQDQGRLAEAAALAERLLGGRAETLGVDHPRTRFAQRLVEVLRAPLGS